jgi:CRISPR-associated protein Cas1
MRIVKAKIRGQAHNLEKYSSEFATPIHARVSDVKSGDSTNVEAQAARAYWSRYIPGEEFSRDRNAGGRNSLLNYG